jgi:hypothetical protein
VRVSCRCPATNAGIVWWCAAKINRAGIGVGVDTLRKEHTTVYRVRGLTESTTRLALLPLLSKKRKGLLFSVTW